MLPILFAAFTMSSVGKSAGQMVEEVRRQFREEKGILEGTVKPDYEKCVGISTDAALREMMTPAMNILIKLMAIVSLVFAPLILKIGGLFF